VSGSEPRRSIAKATSAWTASTTKTVGGCFVAVAALVYAYDLHRQVQDHLTDGAGRPFGDDFINFWSGAYLAWHGRAPEIYDPAAFHAFEQSVVGASLNDYHYSYPPVLLLLTVPFMLMPYVPALFAWLIAGWYAFYRALRLAVPGRNGLLLALSAPAVFINAVSGQNGTWTAALFGGGLSMLEKRPLVAGGLLGLLIYKPQLGLLVPVALLAGRHWRAFTAASVVACVLVALSAIQFGTDVWIDYLRNLGILRHMILEDGTGVWHRFVSVFVGARRLGAPVPAAYVIQALTGLLACIAVGWVWLGDAPLELKNAVLVLGTCLATPYLQDYDLVIGALVVVWLRQCAVPHPSEWTPQVSAGLFFLLPLFGATLANLTGLALGPLFIVPIFVVALQMNFGAKRARSVLPPTLSPERMPS
jgi:arabinofuranan 3-O-arabinosyltransferase